MAILDPASARGNFYFSDHTGDAYELNLVTDGVGNHTPLKNALIGVTAGYFYYQTRGRMIDTVDNLPIVAPPATAQVNIVWVVTYLDLTTQLVGTYEIPTADLTILPSGGVFLDINEVGSPAETLKLEFNGRVRSYLDNPIDVLSVGWAVR